MDWTPELGQLVWSNAPMAAHGLPWYAMDGLLQLGDAISELRDDEPLTINYGSPPFENNVFAMRTYCWCDGESSGHEDGCPPNFEYKPRGLRVFWYKHVGRGASVTEQLTPDDWRALIAHCIDSLQP